MCPGKVLPKENESLEDTMNIAREKIRTKRGSKAYLARRGKEIHNVEGGGEIDPWSIVRGVEKVRETQTTEGVARDITPLLPIPSLHIRTPTPPHSRAGSLTPPYQRNLAVTPFHSFPSPSSSPVRMYSSFTRREEKRSRL